ncbi:cytochrome bd oxidase small subunit CydS [Oceanobacillus damuensis]
MINDFLVFVAPFLIIIGAIALAFWAAGKDEPVNKNKLL